MRPRGCSWKANSVSGLIGLYWGRVGSVRRDRSSRSCCSGSRPGEYRDPTRWHARGRVPPRGVWGAVYGSDPRWGVGDRQPALEERAFPLSLLLRLPQVTNSQNEGVARP